MTGLLSIIRTHWVGFTLTILMAITILSIWPLNELPSVPGTDKAHHLIAYALLMLPTALRKPKNWLLFGILFIFYSGAIELIQPYVNRHGQWMDLLANAAGVICGVIAAQLIDFFTSSR